MLKGNRMKNLIMSMSLVMLSAGCIMDNNQKTFIETHESSLITTNNIKKEGWICTPAGAGMQSTCFKK